MTSDSLTCSGWSRVDEPLPGTATQTVAWLCVEHDGPWGRDVVKDAVLGEQLTSVLAQRLDRSGVRLMLIRRIGRRAAREHHSVFLANSRHGWLSRIEVLDYDELGFIDLDSLNSEHLPMGEIVTEPMVLVCTHGRRDQCCARVGRPIAAGIADQYPETVWECSHTGGHRFAPSMIVLPSGYTYGRLDAESSVEVVAAAIRGEVAVTGLRGRSSMSPREQAAEVAVRQSDSAASGQLTVEDRRDHVLVSAATMRWRVEVKTIELSPRPASCGADPAPISSVHVTSIVKTGE